MKQVTQSLSTGKIEIVDIPLPKPNRGELLIRTQCSLLSSGTEKMLLNFGKANLFNKAKNNPERVNELIEKVLTDGVLTTYEAVINKLDTPIPLGYCNVGVVEEVGTNIEGFNIGDRVISNGAHAEFVVVPQNLCALIPNSVTDEQAVFTVLGAIGLQGIRLAEPTFGETFVVSGLGLIGLLTAQLLKGNGCRVLGIDPDPNKISLAKTLGIETLPPSLDHDYVSWCKSLTNDFGVDGFIVTASTNSSNPISIAAKSCRQRGRIILVGVTGLELDRNEFYKKELTFKVSCSYGPGRYDSNYEKEGNDYPVGFVRWTEQRNFAAILNSLEAGVLNTKKLISYHFDHSNSYSAYEKLFSDKSCLGIILKYKNQREIKRTLHIESSSSNFKSKCILGFIGTGNYASRFLLPSLKSHNIYFHTLVTNKDINSAKLATKYNFANLTTEDSFVWGNSTLNTIIIATRHDSHADYICKGLNSGKNVFVEKPLCLNKEQFDSISESYLKSRKDDGSGPLLMVGYNRRFSKLTKILKELLELKGSPKSFIYTCNAGYLDTSHWTQDPKIGGGRFLGEACHFIDLMMYLSGSNIKTLNLNNAIDKKERPDTFSVEIKFKNGSIGTLHYFSNGNKRFPKERLEVFCSGSIFRLDNFLTLKAWGSEGLGFRTKRLLKQDKGNKACMDSFIKSIENGLNSPIPHQNIFEVQRFLLKAMNNV